jgi:hypothetical protein
MIKDNSFTHNMPTRKTSREYKAYQVLQHWKRTKKKYSAESLFNKKNTYFPLFQYLYQITKELYFQIPKRKNGEKAFVHPINIVLALKEAKITDEVSLCGGIIHDYVEEKVDLYKRENKIKIDKKGIKELDDYEVVVFEELEKKLNKICIKLKIDKIIVNKLINVTKLLTRHKRDYYFQSISNIFTFSQDKITHRALLIKLSDRMHNILCIECFNEEERIYQCFKNLFLLNSAKKYMIEKYGKEVFTKTPYPPLELLYKRCCKATYDAFLRICHLSSKKGVRNVKSILQLAFKKFALEQNGTRSVTSLVKKEPHPVRLFRGIIHKYDARLFHNWKKFDLDKESEKKYCMNFFADFNFSEKKIQGIIDYKDAYALKEVVAYLLYVPDYFITGFEYSTFKKLKKV